MVGNWYEIIGDKLCFHKRGRWCYVIFFSSAVFFHDLFFAHKLFFCSSVDSFLSWILILEGKLFFEKNHVHPQIGGFSRILYYVLHLFELKYIRLLRIKIQRRASFYFSCMDNRLSCLEYSFGRMDCHEKIFHRDPNGRIVCLISQ